jgi:hypothetical protein
MRLIDIFDAFYNPVVVTAVVVVVVDAGACVFNAVVQPA